MELPTYIKRRPNETKHWLNIEQKAFLSDLIDHWLAQKEAMLDVAHKDDIFINSTDDLLKVTASIYSNEAMGVTLLKEFSNDP